MPRPKRVADTQIAEALQQNKGLISLAARQVGLNADWLRKRIAKSNSLQAVKQNSREDLVDVAESRLFAALERDEAWAICFFLKTQAKHRGYVERMEQSGPDGKPLVLVAEQVVYVNEAARPGIEAEHGGQADPLEPGASGLLPE